MPRRPGSRNKNLDLVMERIDGTNRFRRGKKCRRGKHDEWLKVPKGYSCYPCQLAGVAKWQRVQRRVARDYRDLERAGRIIVLPDGLTKDNVMVIVEVQTGDTLEQGRVEPDSEGTVGSYSAS